MIAFEDCAFRYPEGEWRLGPLTYGFEGGVLHAIVGPSGCGKTTLLYLMAGLLSPAGGRVLLDGVPVARGRVGTAVILQDFGLFPWKTVEANLAVGLRLRDVGKSARSAAIGRVLDELGLAGKEKLYPKHLSGGEKQRLAIGRALVLEPDLLLMDEPFSSLDAMTREALQDRLLDVRARHRMGVVLVTHSIEEAAYLGDRVHVMDAAGRLRPARDAAGGHDRSADAFFRGCVALRRELAGRAAAP